MKKNLASKFGIFNPRALIAFTLCSVRAFLALLSFATNPPTGPGRSIGTGRGGNPHEFIVRSYQGSSRCLDYTPDVAGSPVFINDCARAHRIVVEEIDNQHDVILHAGTKVIAAQVGTAVIKTMGSTGGPAAPGGPGWTEFPLVLTAPNAAQRVSVLSANTHFALDGDSIIFTLNRTMVAKVHNARGAIGTPVVLGARNLADNEFWDFLPTNGIDHDPTSGFIRIGVAGDPAASRNQLLQYIPQYDVTGAHPVCQQVSMPTMLAGPGTVIRIMADVDLTGCTKLEIPSGVTIRGDRLGTVFGPEIRSSYVFLRVDPLCTECSNSSSDPNPEDCCRNFLDSCNCISNFQTISGCVPQVTFAQDCITAAHCCVGVGCCPGSTVPIDPMLDTFGANDVRITRLRLRGPSRKTDEDQTTARGVATYETNVRNIVDHNDVSDWPENGIRVLGSDGPAETPPSPAVTVADLAALAALCSGTGGDPQVRPTTAFVARNFIHHNRRQEGGYGVESYRGAYPFIQGNTFVSNRHAIAAGFGSVHTAYRAWFNLVLSDAPLQHGLFLVQDFDMHGTAHSHDCAPFSSGIGGLGGDYMDIYRNTFFGTNRPNFKLRGIPCNYAAFHDNVSLKSQEDVVQLELVEFPWCAVAVGGTDPIRVSPHPDQFKHSNPTVQLGVGDFDGDRADDLFLATGTAWYYSPGGKAEWRFLSAKTDTIDQLLFGDFDGDGRTDVVAIHDGQFVVSWGGVSDWEVLNPNPTHGNLFLLPSAVTAMAVGDFDGDGVSDIFYADGQTWWVSYGGNTPFVEVQTSSFRRKDLLFGDFDGNGTTDVFSVGSVNWQVSYSPKGVHGLFTSWQPLRAKLTDTVQGLVVADFNGDGFADVAATCDNPDTCSWKISYYGFEDWYHVSQPGFYEQPSFTAVGRFRGYASADVLLWDGINPYGGGDKCTSGGVSTQFCVSVAGIYPVQLYSPQDMR